MTQKIINESNFMYFKNKCITYMKGPNLIKTVVTFACVVLVIEQMTFSIKKIINVPITTYTHFDFNDTMMYPSVTLCREPPYKYHNLKKYGLYAHPLFTSTWRNFDFSNVSLDDMWDDVTYSPLETFVQYGILNSVNNVELKAEKGFIHGQCFTLKPKTHLTTASKETGYSITLKQTAEDLANSISTYPPGYHVYIHYWMEPFTEIEVQNGGLIEHLYVHSGEEVDIKLTVDEYVKVNEENDQCTDERTYSANECAAKEVWKLVEAEAKCSGPWMRSSLPRCSNYSSMRKLITTYNNLYQGHEFPDCLRLCHTYLYNAYVTNRQLNYLWDQDTRQWAQRTGDAALQSQLYIHFNSMMVTVYQEKFNYDWNLFLSDLGGNVGFLLGLSVISLIGIIVKVLSLLLSPFLSKTDADASTNSSKADLDIIKETEDYMKKCHDWNTKNDGMLS